MSDEEVSSSKTQMKKQKRQQRQNKGGGDSPTVGKNKNDKSENGSKSSLPQVEKTKTKSDQPVKADKTAAMKTIMAEATRAGIKGDTVAKFTVKLEDFSLEFSGKPLLENTSLTLAFGKRYGLVGPNGSGKSTLMRALGKREIPGIPKDIQLLYVEQEVEGHPEKSALDMVIEADTERTQLLVEQKELEAAKKTNEEAEDYDEQVQEKLTDIHKKLHSIGAHSAEHRARTILTGLQFTQRMQTCPTQELSGGWRMRIALARSLFCRPHLLLLDEPSNHLDLYACFWLEGFLKKWKKTLLVVSHDVEMLNEICDNIIQLDPHTKKLVQFKGNYDDYLHSSALRATEYKKKYEKQQKKLAALQKSKEVTTKAIKTTKGKDKGRGNIERSGGQAQHRKQVNRKEELMAKEEVLAPPPKEYSVSFQWDDPDTLPHPVLQVKGVSFAYPDQPTIFRNLELGVDLDLRVAVVGRNGVGKSTLMKIVLGELKPTNGEVLHSPKLRVAHFSQHFVDQLPMDKTPADYLCETYKGVEVKDARKYLGRFGVTGKVQVNPMSTLSGGQKSRVMFCSLALQNPHIMFLDEPTNHLDIQSIEALAEGLRNFKGGVFLITHNQRLIGASCDRIWIVEGNQSVSVWKGEFKEYQQSVMDTLHWDEDEED